MKSDNAGWAEVAFTVDDNFQGIGVGSLLLKHLIFIARQRGIEAFIATILPTNGPMIRILQHAQAPMEKTVACEFIEFTLNLRTTE